MEYFVLYENNTMRLLGEGVEFSDGKVVFRWSGDVSSIVIHDNMANFHLISMNKDRQIVTSCKGKMNKPFYFTDKIVIEDDLTDLEWNTSAGSFVCYPKYNLDEWKTHVRIYSRESGIPLKDAINMSIVTTSYAKLLIKPLP